MQLKAFTDRCRRMGIPTEARFGILTLERERSVLEVCTAGVRSLPQRQSTAFPWGTEALLPAETKEPQQTLPQGYSIRRETILAELAERRRQRRNPLISPDTQPLPQWREQMHTFLENCGVPQLQVLVLTGDPCGVKTIPLWANLLEGIHVVWSISPAEAWQLGVRDCVLFREDPQHIPDIDLIQKTFLQAWKWTNRWLEQGSLTGKDCVSAKLMQILCTGTAHSLRTARIETSEGIAGCPRKEKPHLNQSLDPARESPPSPANLQEWLRLKKQDGEALDQEHSLLFPIELQNCYAMAAAVTMLLLELAPWAMEYLVRQTPDVAWAFLEGRLSREAGAAEAWACPDFSDAPQAAMDRLMAIVKEEQRARENFGDWKARKGARIRAAYAPALRLCNPSSRTVPPQRRKIPPRRR